MLEKFAIELVEPDYSIVFISLVFDGKNPEENKEKFQLIKSTFSAE